MHAALVTPLTGPLASYGQAGATALELWAERGTDEAAIELAVYDAHPDPAAAVHQAEHARPDVLFGPYGSSPTVATARASSRLVFNHGGARAGRAENLISVLAPASSYFAGPIAAVRASAADVRRVCLAHGDTGFARDVADGAARAATDAGLEVHRTVLPADPPGGDMLLVAGSFETELAAARRLLPGRWTAAGFVGAGVAEVLAELGPARDGLLGPAQWLPDSAPEPDDGPSAEQFVAAYRDRTGHEPPYPAAQAYAAGVIAARCVAEAGTAEDAAVLAAARRLDLRTMFGRFRLDLSTGEQVGHEVLTVQWQDGIRRFVWPPQQAKATLRIPYA